jgi:hypothetical protein
VGGGKLIALGGAFHLRDQVGVRDVVVASGHGCGVDEGGGESGEQVARGAVIEVRVPQPVLAAEPGGQ